MTSSNTTTANTTTASSPTPLDIVDVEPDQPLLFDDIEALARRYHSAVAFRIPGLDRSRARVASTLLHGNEPSGARAVLRLLAEGIAPAVDTILVLGALEAASALPTFGHRFLPGRRDRNRVFGSDRIAGAAAGDPDHAFACAVLELVGADNIEALIDIHNNTGHNPAYGIATRAEAARLGLVELFANRAIVTDLRLDTMMEAVDDRMPAVSIEVGRAGDPAADELAYDGLRRFLGADTLAPLTRPMALYTNPIRVELASGATVAFASHHLDGPSIVFSDEIDHHNFNTVVAGTPLGWVNDERWPLACLDDRGDDISRSLFEVAGGVLRSRADLVPIMMTLDANVAVQDCLFYIVRDKTQFAPA